MGSRTDTRARMVSAAARLLSEQGVAGTTVTSVLEASHGPRGSVGHHFRGGRTEILTDALTLVGGQVSAVLHSAEESGHSAERVYLAICGYYRDAMTTSDFVAGCPVGAAAQEVFADPHLGPVIVQVMGEWQAALTRLLTRDGHSSASADELAVLAIGALEGGLLLARVQRSTAAIDAVVARIAPLLRPSAQH